MNDSSGGASKGQGDEGVGMGRIAPVELLTEEEAAMRAEEEGRGERGEKGGGRGRHVYLRAEYEREVDPLPAWNAEDVVERLAAFTARQADAGPSNTQETRKKTPKEIAEAAVKEVRDASQFAERHPLLFEQLTTPSFVKNEAQMGVVRLMLRTRADVEAGILSDSEARSKVADHTLLVMATQAQKRDGKI